MTDARELQTLGISRLLSEQPGLRLAPPSGEGYVLAGAFELHAQYGDRTIADRFQIEIVIDPHVLARPPQVRETGGRIPANFHQFDGGILCVGSPLRIRDALIGPEPIVRYVAQLLVPYLYSWAHLQEFNTLPFGELGHGSRGLYDDYRSLLGLSSDEACFEAFKLLALRKRLANKRACPCGSGRRLGRCHSRLFNRWRGRHGRSWFAGQVKEVAPPRPARKPRWRIPAALASELGFARVAARGKAAAAGRVQQGLRQASGPPADGPTVFDTVVGPG